MKCANCQAQIPENSQFCLKCGNPQATASVETVPKPDEQKKAGLTPTHKVGIGCLGLVFLLFVISQIGKNGSNPSPPMPPSKNIGDDAVLALPGSSEKILVCVDEKAHSDFMSAAVAKDNIGIAQIVLQNRAFLVDTNTKVKVIDQGFTKKKVRILEGPMFGRSGWVAREWVK